MTINKSLILLLSAGMGLEVFDGSAELTLAKETTPLEWLLFRNRLGLVSYHKLNGYVGLSGMRIEGGYAYFDEETRRRASELLKTL